jgi:hypothetical protein
VNSQGVINFTAQTLTRRLQAVEESIVAYVKELKANAAEQGPFWIL